MTCGMCLRLLCTGLSRLTPLLSPYLIGVNDADIALSENFDALGFDTSFRSWESDDE